MNIDDEAEIRLTAEFLGLTRVPCFRGCPNPDHVQWPDIARDGNASEEARERLVEMGYEWELSYISAREYEMNIWHKDDDPSANVLSSERGSTERLAVRAAVAALAVAVKEKP